MVTRIAIVKMHTQDCHPSLRCLKPTIKTLELGEKISSKLKIKATEHRLTMPFW